MPSPSAFRNAFDLKIGTKFGPLTLTNVSVKHNCVKKYVEYEFPTTLTFTGKEYTSAKLKSSLLKALKGDKIVMSNYGSPYECKFKFDNTLKIYESKPNEETGEKQFEVSILGSGVRRYDIDTMSEETKKKHKLSKAKEDENIEELKKRGYRVTKAHFATGHCSVCELPLLPGENIARHESLQMRPHRTWAHVDCQV